MNHDNYGYNGQKDYEADSKGIVTIPNLSPNKTVSIAAYSYYDQIRRDIAKTDYATKDIDVNLTEMNEGNGATSLCIQGLYDIGDATFKTSGFTAPSSIEGNTILLTGLEPNRTTTVSYYVTVKEGGYTKKQTSTFTTPELQFTTLKAKATSNTKAVICAEANIANEETGTGFEWRRVDAPDIVPSEEVYCAVHDGVMEGILNNLSANTYYQYRPFYKSAAGNMYYGDWIGFGTADAYVYFTPTVHTYATATVENNTATLNGYALSGSDDIVEQGFEYWADDLEGTRATGEVMTVTATGQRMSITLTDLAYNTTYRYRAYVKTAKETTYGEEMSFSTGDDPTGIDGVATEDLHIDVRTVQGGIEFRLNGETASSVRYALYTLNGVLVANGKATVGEDWQRIGENALMQGLYLLRVEDGKQCRTLKVLVK